MVCFDFVIVPLRGVLRMLPALGLVLLFTLGIVFETAAAGQDRAAYRAWCKSQGGTTYSFEGGLACRPGSRRPPTTGTTTAPVQPAPDYQLEQRRREAERQQRERERSEKAERDRKRAFERAKGEALGLLKGSSPGSGGLKSSGGGDLNLKSGTPTFGIKGNPAQGLTLKTSTPSTETRMVTKRSRFSKGTKYSAPVVTDPRKVQSGTQRELNSANRKTELLLDALHAAKGSWAKALGYLRAWVKASPNDTDARQALSYLRGFHGGYLGASVLGNIYYKYGVREWIAGDYHSAAKAFAQAVAENPLDTQAVATYGYTLGLAMESPACQRRPKSCPYIDLPSRIIADSPGRRQDLAQLQRRIKQNPNDLKTRLALEYVKGLLVYAEPGVADLAFRGKPPDAVEGKLMTAGFKKLVRRDYAGAVKAYSRAYTHNVHKRGGVNANGILFAQRYAAGRLAAREGRGDIFSFDDDRVNQVLAEVYNRILDELDRLPPESTSMPLFARTLRDTDGKNPFFGRLAKSKVAGLMRKALGR